MFDYGNTGQQRTLPYERISSRLWEEREERGGGISEGPRGIIATAKKTIVQTLNGILAVYYSGVRFRMPARFSFWREGKRTIFGESVSLSGSNFERRFETLAQWEKSLSERSFFRRRLISKS